MNILLKRIGAIYLVAILGFGFSSVLYAKDIKKLSVGGLTLGMTPVQVKKILQASSRKYLLQEKVLIVNGHRFVAKTTTFLRDPKVTRRLGMGVIDRISVHYAPPPSKQRALLIIRERKFGKYEFIPPKRLMSAIIRKYGKSDFKEFPNKGLNYIQRYYWKLGRKHVWQCRRMADYYKTDRQYIFQDRTSLGTFFTGRFSCPVFLSVKKIDGLNYVKQRRGIKDFDHVNQMNSVLIDYKKVVKTGALLSAETRKRQQQRMKKDARKRVPVDL